MKNVVPDSKMVKMRYVEQFTLDPGAGVTATNVFRANSTFDPNASGVGHQPMGRDQWLPFYDHYTVVSSKITVMFGASADVASTGLGLVGIYLKDNVSTIPGPTDIMEQTGSSYKVITQANATQTTKLSKTFSSKKFFGLQSIKDNRNLVGSPNAANPPEEAYYHVYTTSMESSGNLGPVRCVATIEYLVWLTERTALASS